MSEPDLTPFLRMIRKVRVGMAVFAVICLPFGVLLLFLDDPSMGGAANLALKVGLGGFFLVLGAWFAYLALRSPTRDRGIRTLLDRRDEIVWICPVRNVRSGNHVGTRYDLKLVDGTTRQVAVVPADEERAERILRAHCPSALFGFRREWEQQFESDPVSLSAAARQRE